jgi:hypothetical protein
VLAKFDYSTGVREIAVAVRQLLRQSGTAGQCEQQQMALLKETETWPWVPDRNKHKHINAIDFFY